jgi:hypothetical protein
MGPTHSVEDEVAGAGVEVQDWVPAETCVTPVMASSEVRTVTTPRILRILFFIDF